MLWQRPFFQPPRMHPAKSHRAAVSKENAAREHAELAVVRWIEKQLDRFTVGAVKVECS